MSVIAIADGKVRGGKSFHRGVREFQARFAGTTVASANVRDFVFGKI
jgi:hypothetical protein